MDCDASSRYGYRRRNSAVAGRTDIERHGRVGSAEHESIQASCTGPVCRPSHPHLVEYLHFGAGLGDIGESRSALGGYGVDIVPIFIVPGPPTSLSIQGFSGEVQTARVWWRCAPRELLTRLSRPTATLQIER